MPSEAMKRALPGSYSEMYPSRFLKADMLKGKKVTLTIKAIFGEDLTDADENTKPEWIVQFSERPLEWVMNKTGAYCLFRMFGGDPHTWVGHKVTLFPQPGTWFGEKGEAIRVWGSPELAEDLPITLKFLRKKKDRNMVMHRVETKNGAAPETKPEAQTSPKSDLVATERMAQMFALLGWNKETQDNWLVSNANKTQAELEMKLEEQLDAE